MANWLAGQMFGTIKVLRLATLTEIKIQLRRQNPKTNNRYWYCQCVECGLPFTLRSDNIPKKRHKCFVEKVT